MIAPTQKKLNGNLRLDEGVGRHPKAGLLLRLCIERAHAGRREHAEEPMTEGIEDERVAVSRPLADEELGGIVQQPKASPDPGQTAIDDRRQRSNRREGTGHVSYAHPRRRRSQSHATGRWPSAGTGAQGRWTPAANGAGLVVTSRSSRSVAPHPSWSRWPRCAVREVGITAREGRLPPRPRVQSPCSE